MKHPLSALRTFTIPAAFARDPTRSPTGRPFARPLRPLGFCMDARVTGVAVSRHRSSSSQALRREGHAGPSVEPAAARRPRPHSKTSRRAAWAPRSRLPARPSRGAERASILNGRAAEAEEDVRRHSRKAPFRHGPVSDTRAQCFANFFLKRRGKSPLGQRRGSFTEHSRTSLTGTRNRQGRPPRQAGPHAAASSTGVSGPGSARRPQSQPGLPKHISKTCINRCLRRDSGAL